LRPPKTPRHARGSALWSLIAILLLALAPVAASAQPHLSSLESETAENHSPSGTIPTRPGLQLTVQADCGDVQILTDAADEVSYSVHPHSVIAGRDPAALLVNFSVAARQTPRGVEFVARALKETSCRARVVYEIHVPRRYSLNVAVQSGAISTQDIDGAVAFFTGGGDIRLGSVGSSATTPTLRNSVFSARLESAGGNISAGDISGGLRATTGGGQIIAGDVHGPAMLRTGGGEIRVGHVFGAARLWSGGGNINAGKIDGGIWAETDGGRLQIGDVPAASAFAQESSGGEGEVSVLPARSENGQVQTSNDAPDISRFGRFFDAFVWGGIRVDPAEEQKHLVASVPPNYPEVARLAGIEGDVTLRVLIGEDGTVRDLRPVVGPPVLSRAAMRAVEQWRYAPALVDGHPVEVVTTVTFAFHLR
jgi:TonB family protein